MKRLLLLVLLFPLTVSAQYEFGYHATWYYEYSEFGYSGYKKITHASDTNMLGMDWLKFEVTGVSEIKTGPNPNDIIQSKNVVFPSIYLATRNDSVFRLLNDSSSYLLYDFSATVGDKWQFSPSDTSFGCDSIPVATVTTIGTEMIDGKNMRYLDVAFPMDSVNYGGTSNYQPVSNAILSNRVYPDFGSTGYVVPFVPAPNLCDGSVFRTTQLSNYSLRCFSNDSVSLHFVSWPCDHWDFISVEEYRAINFEAYPNPSGGHLNIQADETVSKVQVYSLGGQMLIETSQTKNIELPASSGMYVVAIHFEDGQKVVTKVVRE
ncbi:T9SS type A sorting domain-containing protein [Owenweeksia hongkongensis]|uniref:T9SS type A sorting domain-containing protein n=1 Tax=Owenweeksia hongkongensis TaxID=253245 RepID=UPI003A8D49CF